MSDKEFQKLLDRLTKANVKYKSLLNQAEEEFMTRFGATPGDVDCDYWIDTFHIGAGIMTVKELTTYMNDILDKTT